MEYVVLVGIIILVWGIPAIFMLINSIRDNRKFKKNQSPSNVPNKEKSDCSDTTEVLHHDIIARHLKGVNR